MRGSGAAATPLPATSWQRAAQHSAPLNGGAPRRGNCDCSQQLAAEQQQPQSRAAWARAWARADRQGASGGVQAGEELSGTASASAADPAPAPLPRPPVCRPPIARTSPTSPGASSPSRPLLVHTAAGNQSVGHLHAPTQRGFLSLCRPDATLACGGLLFPAHRQLLAVSSRFFCDFFLFLKARGGAAAASCEGRGAREGGGHRGTPPNRCPRTPAPRRARGSQR